MSWDRLMEAAAECEALGMAEGDGRGGYRITPLGKAYIEYVVQPGETDAATVFALGAMWGRKRKND